MRNKFILKMDNMKKGFLIIAVFFALINLIYAEQNTKNISIEQKAGICLEESRQIISNMQMENFSVLRINDSLKQAKNFYDAHLILKEKNKNYDFSVVIPYCDEIKRIKESAFSSRDKLSALKKFYMDLVEPGMNTSSADSLMNEAEAEMKNEKYERVPSLVDSSYKEITNIKTSYTALNLFYETTTKNLKKILYKNRYFIISSFIILITLFLIYRQAIRKWILHKKIKNLELRKKNLKDMIMEIQKNYFEKGAISEGIFNIRTKKLAELIRDIDRQIPLLEEDLIKMGDKSNPFKRI